MEFDLLGMRLTAADAASVWRSVADEAVHGGPGGYLVFANVHVTVQTVRDVEYGRAVQGSRMTLPDSTPLFWIARRRGANLRERVYGPDFMRRGLEASRDGSVRHFFYGGTDALLERLKQRVQTEYPGVQVCGMLAPPFRDLSEAELIRDAEEIAQARPHIVWVGLGCPKQEFWMNRQSGRLKGIWMAGVGQAFDQIAGVKTPAPRWMQKAGLEWLYRLCREPTRLTGRYLVGNSLFVWYGILETLRLRRFKK